MRYIAFLRAINVGGHVVKMDRLRTLFEALKLKDVETFIASGNVIFSTGSTDEGALVRKLETHLEKSLGYAVATFLRTPEELRAIAKYQPFDDEAFSRKHALYVGLLQSRPGREEQKRLLSLGTAVDELHVAGREFYWLARESFADTKLNGNVLEKALGGPTTLRNINTMQRLAAKFGAGE